MAEVLENNGDHPPAGVVSDGSMSSKDDDVSNSIDSTEKAEIVVKPNQDSFPSEATDVVLSATKSSEIPFDEPDCVESSTGSPSVDKPPATVVEQHDVNASQKTLEASPSVQDQNVPAKNDNAPFEEEEEEGIPAVEDSTVVTALEIVAETTPPHAVPPSAVEANVTVEVQDDEPPSDEEREVRGKPSDELQPPLSLERKKDNVTTEVEAAKDTNPIDAESAGQVFAKVAEQEMEDQPTCTEPELLARPLSEPNKDNVTANVAEETTPEDSNPIDSQKNADQVFAKVAERKVEDQRSCTEPEFLETSATSSTLAVPEEANLPEKKDVDSFVDKSNAETEVLLEAPLDSTPPVVVPIEVKGEDNILDVNKESIPTEETFSPFELAQESHSMEVEGAVEADLKTQEANDESGEAIDEASDLAQEVARAYPDTTCDEAKETNDAAVEVVVEPKVDETAVSVPQLSTEQKVSSVETENKLPDEPIVQENQPEAILVAAVDEQKEALVESEALPADEPELQKETQPAAKERVEPQQPEPESTGEPNVQDLGQDEHFIVTEISSGQGRDAATDSIGLADVPGKTTEPKLEDATMPIGEEQAQEGQESPAVVSTFSAQVPQAERQSAPSLTKPEQTLASPEESSDVDQVSPVGETEKGVEAAVSPKNPRSPPSKLTIPSPYSASSSKAAESPANTPAKVRVPALFCETDPNSSSEATDAIPSKSPVRSPGSGRIKIPAAFLSGSSTPTPQSPTTPSSRKKLSIPAAFSAKVESEAIAERKKVEEEEARKKAAEEAAKKREEEQARKKAAEEAARKKAEEEARKVAEAAAREKAEEEARQKAIKEAEQKQKLVEEIKRVETELASAKIEKELNASKEVLMEEIAAVDAEIAAAKAEKEVDAPIDANVQVDAKEEDSVDPLKVHAGVPQSHVEVTPGLVKEVSKRLESPKPEKNKLAEQLHEQAISAANSEISQSEAHVKDIIEKIESPKGKGEVEKSVDVRKVATMPSLGDSLEEGSGSPARETAPVVQKISTDAALTSTPPMSPSSLPPGSSRDADAANQASGGACGCECVLL